MAAAPRKRFDVVAYLKLFRFPLVFTAIADSAAGHVIGRSYGRPEQGYTLPALGKLALMSAGLYLFGMALNDLADRKKEIFDDDLISIVKDDIAQVPETYTLDYLHSISGTGIIPSATVRLKKEEQVFQDSGVGDGPVDAVLNAIDAITGMKGRLQDYQLRAVTSGKDALGEVSVKVDFDGTVVFGKGTSTDVIEASARAYINAVNRLVHPARGRDVQEVGP